MRNVTAGGAGVLTTLLVAIVPAARAGAFEVPIDPSQSSLTFELCLSGACDNDTSAVAGSVTIALDSVDFPSQIWLHDFTLNLVDSVAFSLSWGVFGSFNATIADGGLLYADPNVVLGPETIAAQAFVFPSVPTAGRGLLAYSATGLPCVALEAAGLPCTDTDDLSSEPAQNAELGGEITAVNRIVTLAADVDRTTPIDPNNPDLGTIRVFGRVTGQVLVPRPLGDVDGDGDVDLRDAQLWMLCCNGPDVTAPPPGCSAYHFSGSDLDGDGDVDLADVWVLAPLVAD